jgi:hypothetical protein
MSKLLDDSKDLIEKQYTKLPSYLQKLVMTLPTKLTSTLAPELLAAAAEGQALNTASASGMGKAGFASLAAKAGTKIPSLKELVTKPGAIVTMLKAIMNFLKTRFPAFLGTNVLWSLGLFVLLFVFWYCHKRGKEVRLEKEEAERQAVDPTFQPGVVLGEVGTPGEALDVPLPVSQAPTPSAEKTLEQAEVSTKTTPTAAV